MDNSLWESVKPDFVPEISDDEIVAMRTKIQPLLRLEGTSFYQRIANIDLRDARRESFLWDAESQGSKMAFGALERVSIITFHKWGAPVFFKPSLAEVYASIKRFVPDWEHVHFFCLRSEDMGPDHVIGDCHWCVCDLFGMPCTIEDIEYAELIVR